MIALSTTLCQAISVACSPADAHRYLVEHFTESATIPPTVLLRVPLADLALDREIVVQLTDLPSPAAAPVMEIRWSAQGGGPYPAFIGSLACLPDLAGASRIELEGTYTIPGGIVGKAFDAVVGHRIAVAAAQSLLRSLLAIVDLARDDERAQRSRLMPKAYPPTYE